MDIEKVVSYIQSEKSRSFLSIAKHFRILPKDNHKLTKILSQLQKEYKIFKNNNDEYYAPILVDIIEGVLNVNNKGQFGFVDYNIDEVKNTKDSVYIRNFNFNSALHNDKVKVKVFKNPKDDKSDLTSGVVVEIIERGNDEIVGFIKLKNNTNYFVPVEAKMKTLTWTIIPNLIPIKLNDLVVAKILKYDSKNVLIEITKVITNEADPMVYVKSYLEQIKAPNSFPEILDNEIDNIPETIESEDLSRRVDLTDKMIVTIDGDETKDFDDAIYVKKLENGNYFLGVYIADVSHYVKEGTEIDSEALKRGTSIYLVDRVIPMLPFGLSNGICSLNPNEKRFVIACEMEIDKYGNNVKVDIFEGIIESKFRLTYKQVDKFFNENKLVFTQEPKNDVDKLKLMLNDAKELSLVLHDFKIKQGYVDFEIVEPKIKLDNEGRVSHILINERGFSEVLIEDFMVRANETVAKYLYDNKLPVLYRIHELPDQEKITNLKNTLEAIGIKSENLNFNKLSPKSFSKIVEKIKEHRNDDFIKLMFLRTMQKAIYSPENIGHFGLASEYYCHFTSPIRRYPDLVIHRVIRNFLIDKKEDKIDEYRSKIISYGDLNTKSEQKAVQIERNVNDLKFAEFLKNQIGKKYKVQILSILNFGFFVEFDFKASGLVHKTSLIDDLYEANDTLTKLIGTKTKKTFTIGDYVEVVILGVDLVEGKVDCCLASLYPEFIAKKEKDEQFRRNHETNRRFKKS
ncbi:ribonuclease R [Mycoplasma sp. CSL7503-lung]|uniref:ribonuclease R n=1 Tax=Mycoplasma sp. CSL7503-lung TaxID=536372 RepID=UPI0021CFDC95|nr:ribonuclease R [Mycoplasma sp. CSL7503-lung]MCU4706573.1 ribonuclease R [Mycoplasma sp. CSL7503-lung]